MRHGTNMRKVASFDVDAQKGFTKICPNELPVPDGDGILQTVAKTVLTDSLSRNSPLPLNSYKRGN